MLSCFPACACGRISQQSRGRRRCRLQVPVNHPRRSLFHMTLARVTRAYPTDMAVRAIEQSVGVFGHHRLCSFDFAGKTYSASDC